eukprot:CAMPEP_0172431042 /NCGR_PEP_ID=MMETSP1064-20121228/57021_1 /TAXON_ID=202472 /ORGANISM="Aulacoseira subarctica , Strain CCAP 1002/5" /LENGTH=77 /DNA_ID=CAMNT_0013177505 /DNA_START=248 /DNA_END=481 /DNA_ORIENTATION=+
MTSHKGVSSAEAGSEEAVNSETIRHLGGKLAAVKQESDLNPDNWLSEKVPAKTTRPATKKGKVAEGQPKPRAWAADK